VTAAVTIAQITLTVHEQQELQEHCIGKATTCHWRKN
jgi:hypothetical protein